MRAALFNAVDLILVLVEVVVQLLGGTHTGFSALILSVVRLLVSGRRSLSRFLAHVVGVACDPRSLLRGEIHVHDRNLLGRVQSHTNVVVIVPELGFFGPFTDVVLNLLRHYQILLKYFNY
jgi:hypothetical protein